MQQIRNLLDQLALLSDTDWGFFSSCLEPFEIKRGKTVLKQGNVEEYIRFVSEGIVRQFIPMKGGSENSETTIGFVFSGQFISAYDSFLTQQPCLYEMDTLTDVKGFRIHVDQMRLVYQKTETGNEIGRKIAELQFIRKAHREISLLTKSAEERYLDLFEERPELIQLIPLKYIASYIGITPQALSRIRKRIVGSGK